MKFGKVVFKGLEMKRCEENKFARVASAGRAAFTIVELLVASVVGSLTLIGVHGVFLQAMDVEKRASIRREGLGLANAVAAHLAETLEGAVNLLPEVPSIIGGPESDGGGYSMKCIVGIGGAGGACLQRRRYRWNRLGDQGRSSELELQVMKYAGTRNVTALSGIEELTEEEQWSRIPPVVIGKQLSGLSVLYRKTSDPAAGWKDSWRGSAGDVAVRIRVKVEGETVERVVVPQVNAKLVASED